MAQERSVLVTGASGMVGRAALEALASTGWEIHAICRTRQANSQAVTWHAGDLLDPEAMRRIVHRLRCRRLLHLAWVTEPPGYWTSALNLDWAVASARLVQAFATAGGEHAVFAGSCAEYEWSSGHLVEDTTPLAPATPYGRAKLALLWLARDWARTRGIGFAWGRVFFTFGPFEHPSRLVAAVARSLLAGQPIDCSHGLQVRDLLYSRDVGAAFAQLLSSDFEGELNVCSGAGTPLVDLVRAVGEEIGRPELIRLGALAPRQGDPPRLVGDASRLNATGWQPTWQLRNAVQDVVRWWRGRPNTLSARVTR